MHARWKRPRLNAEPNVIPFIDVMLVLLVIFMVSAPPPQTEVQVNLPYGVVKVRQSADLPTSVTVSGADGALVLSIEGEVVPADRFRDRLFEVARARNPSRDLTQLFREARIVVSAGQEVRYDAVFGVVDEIGAAGFRSVNLVVEQAA